MACASLRFVMIQRQLSFPLPFSWPRISKNIPEKKNDFKVFILRSGNDFVTLPSIITSVLMIVIFIIIALVKRYSVSPRSPVKSVRTEQNGGLAVAWREWLRYCLYCCVRVVFPHWELMTINNWGVLLFLQLLFLASSFYSTSIEIWWTAQLPSCLVFLDARTHMLLV